MARRDGGTDTATVVSFALDQVLVKIMPLPPVVDAGDLALLSSDERLRADAYRFTADRTAFVARRAALRRLLADVLDVSPEELRFSIEGLGKPVLAYPAADLAFSVSGTSGVAAFAIAHSGRVGIDVERQRPGVWDPVAAALVLSDTEMGLVRSSSDPDRALLRCWTRKEAFAKTGTRGLERSLSSVTVSDETGGEVTVRGITVRSLEAGPDLHGAVAFSAGLRPTVLNAVSGEVTPA
jgi:4'-phosphopantetheinyl transferase